MAGCTHDCNTCGSGCGEAQGAGEIRKAPMNEQSKIRKVIGVISGKGGVGKSSVTAMLASEMARRGTRVAILDADITGPSIPKAFGIKEKAKGNDKVLLPVRTDKFDIATMSINLLLKDDTEPVVWRGPILGGVIEQFWTDVVWGDVDVMLVDMPPGTGDVALTVFQSLPVDGIVIVTSPQELVSMIVEKAVKMAKIMEIPIVGLVENFSYYKCPDCGSNHSIFGESKIQREAEKYGIKATAKLPIDPEVAQKCDLGKAEEIETNLLDDIIEAIKPE